jgi:circadian clock protein KaiC
MPRVKPSPTRQFITTGVPNLDTMLGNGIPQGSLSLIMGLPGSGKTTLASQICFHAASQGKQTLILTALSESTDKLIGHLREFTFFQENLLGGKVQFFSLQSLLAEGLHATAQAIIAEVRRLNADIVLLDGFRGMRSVDVAPQAAREFLYTLATTLGILGTTIFITSETDPRDPTFFPETTTADNILGLHYSLRGVRQFRSIEIIKLRTNAPLTGLHALVISQAGVQVYPQLEERISLDVRRRQTPSPTEKRLIVSPDPTALQRLSFDLPALDEMLSGGIPRATSTLLAGSLGTGKTLMAMSFAVAAYRAGERAVILGLTARSPAR